MAQLMSRYELRGWERGLAEGREQGQAEGREQGQAEGREQGQQKLLLQMIAGRWGEVDPALQERVRALSGEQVLTLGKALFDFTTRADLEAWLATHTSRPE